MCRELLIQFEFAYVCHLVYVKTKVYDKINIIP